MVMVMEEKIGMKKMRSKMRMSGIAGRAVVILVAFSLNSCMLGKHYKELDLELPQAVVPGAADSLTLADMEWWKFYTDTTLQALIGKTLAYNKDMLTAAARIKEMAALKRIKTAALLPEVSAAASGDREHTDYNGNDLSIDREFGIKGKVAWELDLWGNLRWGREKGIAEYLQSVESRRAMQMMLVAEVATAYYELVALDNELAIVKRTLDTRKEGVHQARLRFEGGLTSETSYQQAQVELASAATLIPDLEKRIVEKENQIALLTGEYPHAIARGTMDIPDIPADLPVGLPSELLKRRPDLRVAEQKLIAANAAVGIAYTDRFPRLTINFTYGVENGKLSQLLGSPYSYLIGSLTSPVFGFGKKKAAYKAQQAVYEQESLQYEKKVLEVFKEVNDAIVSYRSIRETCQLKRNLERAAKKYVDLAQLQYLNGVINYLDVLDAQRKYFDAQIGLSNAVRDEYTALVELYKALGGGWCGSDYSS